MTLRLKLTEAGFEELNSELELKRKKLRELRKYDINESEYEEAKSLYDEINKLRHQIKSAELIELSNKDETVITVGSKIRVCMEYSDEDREEETFILTGGQGKINENKVSVNSPIGECILGKKAGFVGKYSVNEKIIKIKVLKVE